MMYRDHDGVGAIAGVLFLLLLGGAAAALAVGLTMLFRRGRPAAFATAGQAPSGYPPAGGWNADPGTPGGPAPIHPMLAAEQTLADRLARGEIDVADYEQRLAALRRSRPMPSPGPPPSTATFGNPPPPVTPPPPGTTPPPGTPPADPPRP
jgi:hypothetical protein